VFRNSFHFRHGILQAWAPAAALDSELFDIVGRQYKSRADCHKRQDSRELHFCYNTNNSDEREKERKRGKLQ